MRAAREVAHGADRYPGVAAHQSLTQAALLSNRELKSLEAIFYYRTPCLLCRQVFPIQGWKPIAGKPVRSTGRRRRFGTQDEVSVSPSSRRQGNVRGNYQRQSSAP